MNARARGSEARTAAAAWLARRDAGWKAGEEEEFNRWLDADPGHAAAWAEVGDAWRALDSIAAPEFAPSAIRELGRRRRRRRARVYCLAAAVAAVAIVGLTVGNPAAPWQSGRGRMAMAGADPVVLKPERRVLPDGTVVELNQGAEIAVDYGPQARNVRLLRGQANFEVAKNPARPFVVAAGAARIRDVGTIFAVALTAQAVDVTVTEGEVAVNHASPKASSQTSVLVTAGSGLVVPSDPQAPLRAQALSAAEIDRRLAWRAPRLELAGTPLAKVLAELNRSNAVQLAIGDKSISPMRISGVVRADNAAGFVRLLEENYGISAEHRNDRLIVLSRGP